jgi:hypothetical protein
MINYLTHNQIDKSRWDDCIGRSQNRRVYAFSWYLDLVCPGWDALVADEYSSVFPLTHHRKWAISYLYQPYFTQQLGVFSPDAIPESLVATYICAIPPRFRFAEIQLNSLSRYDGGEGETTARVNYECDLTEPYEVLAGKYAENTRRNIGKAHKAGVTVSRTTGVDDLITLFRENFGKKEGKLKDGHYAVLRKLIHHGLTSRMGYILGANTKEGLLSASAFFLFDQARVYFLFAASSPEARANGAMFLLIDRFIAENAGTRLLLDFEGGNDPNLGRFYKGFGATEVPYQGLRINRLFKVAHSLLYFVRKLRK